MIRFIAALIIMLPLDSTAQSQPQRRIRQDDRVNQHLHHTQKKMELQKQKTDVENYKTAPPMERTPTYVDTRSYHSYGVEMQQTNQFEEPQSMQTYDPAGLDNPLPLNQE